MLFVNPREAGSVFCTPPLQAGGKCGEVPGEHGGGGNKGDRGRRGRFLDSTLVAGEEKQLVSEPGQGRTADRCAELVALQSIASGGEIVPRIEISVAEKFESVAVIIVCARLGDCVDSRGRVKSIFGRESAGFDFELLERIGKWQRQVQIVNRIVVVGSVQEIGVTVPDAAGH